MRPTLSLSAPLLLAVTLGCAHGESKPVQASAAPAPTQAVVLGSAVGVDGKPVTLAQVHLGSHSYPVNADGTFRLESAPVGYAKVRFSAVNHAEAETSLWLDPGEHRVEVKLGTHPRADSIEKVGLIIEKNGKLSMKAAIPMQRREDGTFALTVEAPAGRFAYQLLHATTSGNTMNGTQADRFEYDGGGDYLSVLDAPGGPLEVVFDPRKLPAANGQSSLTLAHPLDQQVAQLVADLEELEAGIQQAGLAASKSGGDVKAAVQAFLAGDPHQQAFLSALATEQNPAIRQVLLVAAQSEFVPGAESTRLADAALTEIEAGATVWGINPGALVSMANAASDPALAKTYVDSVIASHPVADVSAAALLHRLRLAITAGDTATAEASFTELTTRFPASLYAFLANRLNPTAPVQPGALVPQFSFPRWEKPQEKITPASLKGKTYLISLWASWCKPCIAKLPTLHALQARYGKQGFTVVAVAIQDKWDAVQTFRQDNAQKWPMPWQHAYVPEDQADAVMKQLSAVGLPSSILVGPDGKILATNTQVDEEGLEKLVEAAMAQRASGR
ncbi:MAG: redoxin family protein [Myxococcota bacterium]|nr:redoxin family protein [Myxococcota bacterium]